MPVHALRGARALVGSANSGLGAAIGGQTVGFADRTREPASVRANLWVWITVKMWTRCGRVLPGSPEGSTFLSSWTEPGLASGLRASRCAYSSARRTTDVRSLVVRHLADRREDLRTPLRLFTRSENLVRLLRRWPAPGWCTMLEFRDGVIKFLKEHPDYVCAECLASSLGVPLHATTMITLGLHRADGFETVDAVCSRCHRRIRVIKAETKT
jgi:hypothetical protein